MQTNNSLNRSGVATGGDNSLPKTSSQWTSTIPAGGVITIPIAGQTFYVLDTTGQLTVRTDHGTKELYDVGTGKVCHPSDLFKYIEITNANAVAVTATVFIGFGDFIDNRLNIVRYREASVQPVADQSTDVIGNAASSIAASGNVVLNGTVPSSSYTSRRWLIVSNRDPNSSLVLLDSTGNFVSEIQKASSQVLFTSGYIKVANQTASAISVCISECWYKQGA